MKIEHAIVRFLADWIVLVLPLSVAAARIALFKFAGDIDEVYRNLLSIPQDLVFIAMSFILAGVTRTIPAYRSHYLTDTEADLMGFLMLVALLILAWAMALMNRLISTLYKNFRTAWNQINRWKREQEDFSWKNTPAEIGGRLLWGIAYISLMSILIAAELLLSFVAVGYSLQHIRP